MNDEVTDTPTRCPAAEDSSVTQLIPEKLWCAYCGAWGNHQSGHCIQLYRDREKALNDENIRLRRLLEKQHDILCQHGLQEYGN